MKIALVSLNQIWENKLQNIIRCESFIKEASLNNIDLIVFPEMTLTGFSMNTTEIAEEYKSSYTIDSFSKLAKEFNISIVFGVVIRKFDYYYNMLVIVDNNGIIVSEYAKIHPFSFSNEDDFYKGGEEVIISKILDVKVGSSICYDLRFPEIFQIMSSSCELVLLIANWPTKRIDHWYTLLKARAIENQIFMVAVNRIGEDLNSNDYSKSSIIVNPNGQILNPFYNTTEIDFYDIEMDQVEKVRKTMSIKKDRKTQLYINYMQ